MILDDVYGELWLFTLVVARIGNKHSANFLNKKQKYREVLILDPWVVSNVWPWSKSMQ